MVTDIGMEIGLTACGAGIAGGSGAFTGGAIGTAVGETGAIGADGGGVVTGVVGGWILIVWPLPAICGSLGALILATFGAFGILGTFGTATFGTVGGFDTDGIPLVAANNAANLGSQP